MFALAQAVSVVLLLEVIPEFIDDFEAKWFLLFNFTIGKIQIFHLILNFYNNFFLIFFLAITVYIMMVIYSLYLEIYDEELNKNNMYASRAFQY